MWLICGSGVQLNLHVNQTVQFPKLPGNQLVNKRSVSSAETNIRYMLRQGEASINGCLHELIAISKVRGVGRMASASSVERNGSFDE